MSLFTSSFRKEAKVLLVVALVLIGVEIGVRLFERRIAVGFNTPKAAEKLMDGEGTRVLFLGNSLVRNGIDTKLFETASQNLGSRPVRAVDSYLVASTVSDWYYILKHSFIETGRKPDTVVVCFAFNYLEDLPMQRSFIAHYYSSINDVPRIFADQVRDFDGRTEFLLFKASFAFSQRTDLHRRTSDVLIPHYRDSAVRINNYLKDQAALRRTPVDPSYGYLVQFLDIARENGISVVFVAMPTQKEYEIEKEVIEMSKRGDLTLIDNRQVSGLGPDAFGDDAHLNDKGKAIYTTLLSNQLGQYLPR